jgi:ParB family chromosome partitioning protein
MSKDRPANKFELKGIDDIFGKDFKNSDEDVFNEADEHTSNDSMEVEIELLQPFKNHPFKVIDDEHMDELVNSIKENGVINPILCRPCATGGLEIISGHRRTHAAKKAGLTKIPAVIRDLSDDDASIIMVDSNIQREEILPSEKAYAYRIKMDAMNRKGQKSNEKINSAKEIGEQTGDSERQVNRYIRLSNLIPELMNLVDLKVLSTFTVGLPLSYLQESEQKIVFDFYSDKALIPSAVQAEALKKLSAEHKQNKTELSVDEVESILFETKEKKKTAIKIDTKKVKKEFFSDDTSVEEMEEVIYKLLTQWKASKNN